MCVCVHVRTHCILGVDEQIRLIDDMIFQLKQDMTTQQQRIEELKFENYELRGQISQVPIKEEGTCTCIVGIYP